MLRRFRSSVASASTRLIAEELLENAHKAGPIKQRQLIDANQLQRLSLTLSRPYLYEGQDIRMEAPASSTRVPPGYHLVYFTPSALPDELGRDGTDSSYHPRYPYTRRMWAGGELRWERDNRLCVGEQVLESTELLSAVGKVGRNGEEMIVVGVQKTYENQCGLALADRRDWVFRKELETPLKSQELASPPSYTLPEPTKPYICSRTFLQTPVTLFRFSALTFNGHKIHYSQPWCREVEGHRDIVVHGPLNLINMLDFWRDTQATKDVEVPKSIKYRATAPFYVNEEYRALLEPGVQKESSIKLWGNDGKGEVRVGMTGDIVAF